MADAAITHDFHRHTRQGAQFSLGMANLIHCASLASDFEKNSIFGIGFVSFFKHP